MAHGEYVAPPYRPPELWTHPLCRDLLTPEVDIWSWGITIYEIYSRKSLLRQFDPQHQSLASACLSWSLYHPMALQNNKKKTLSNMGHLTMWDSFDKEGTARDAILVCCSPSPKQRRGKLQKTICGFSPTSEAALVRQQFEKSDSESAFIN